MFKPIYLIWILGILIAGYFLLRAIIVIIKGTIRIIKNYRKLGRKEFFNKLKDGAERITPLQKTKAELTGMIIQQIGLVCGLIVFPIVRIKNIWWWGEIILLGSFIIGCFGLLGRWQLYKAQKKQDEIIKELNLNEKEI